MFPNKEAINYKVVDHFEYDNFCLDHVSDHLESSKKLIYFL